MKARLFSTVLGAVLCLGAALPAMAVGANALARRWRILTPVVVVLFLVGIPGNVDALLQQRRSEISFQTEYRRLILTLPRVPVAQKVPRSLRSKGSRDVS